MAEQFTAEDFEGWLGPWQHTAETDQDHESRCVAVALRIAAAVMRPGVIEESLEIGLWESSSEAVAAVIRKALTDG